MFLFLKNTGKISHDIIEKTQKVTKTSLIHVMHYCWSALICWLATPVSPFRCPSRVIVRVRPSQFVDYTRRPFSVP